MNRRAFLAATAATTPLIAGCSRRSGGGGSGVTPTQTDTITIERRDFNPLQAAVEPGTEVTWQNNDSYGHSIRSDVFHDVADEWYINARIGPESSLTHTFEEAGIYEYKCRTHGESTGCGAVLVGDVELNEDLPCQG